MISRPAAVWVSHGHGSKVWDVDGTEYVDLHGGYGVMVAGHANPAVVEAVQRRVTQGTHFAQPTDDSIVVARELSAPIRSAVVAVQQLRHRSHDGCHSPDARGHGSRSDHQDRRLATTATTTPSWSRSGAASTCSGPPTSVPRRLRRASRRRWPISCTSCRSTISPRSSACCTPTRARSPG